MTSVQVLDGPAGKCRWTFDKTCTAMFDVDGFSINGSIVDTVDSSFPASIVDFTMTDPIAAGMTWNCDSANIDATWIGASGIADGSGITT